MQETPHNDVFLSYDKTIPVIKKLFIWLLWKVKFHFKQRISENSIHFGGYLISSINTILNSNNLFYSLWIIKTEEFFELD